VGNRAIGPDRDSVRDKAFLVDSTPRQIGVHHDDSAEKAILETAC